jgi:hypothetical protein
VWSDVVTFTDRQAWASASPALTTIDFAGLGGSTPDSDQGYLSGLTEDGVTFNGIDGDGQPYLYVRSARPEVGSPDFLYGPANGPACFTTCGPGNAGSGILVSLPPGTTSVGWDFANFYESGDYGYYYPIGLEVDFSDGTVYTNGYTGRVTPWSGGPMFIGFTSSAPISSFEIMGGGFPTVEDFSFGTTAAAAVTAPEPSSLNLLVLGILAIFAPALVSGANTDRRSTVWRVGPYSTLLRRR